MKRNLLNARVSGASPPVAVVRPCNTAPEWKFDSGACAATIECDGTKGLKDCAGAES